MTNLGGGGMSPNEGNAGGNSGDGGGGRVGGNPNVTTSESLPILTAKMNMQASLMELKDINGVTLIDIPLANSDGQLLTGAEVYEFLQRHFGDSAIRADRAKFIEGINGTKKFLRIPESPLTQSETELVIDTLDNIIFKLQSTPIGDGNMSEQYIPELGEYFMAKCNCGFPTVKGISARYLLNSDNLAVREEQFAHWDLLEELYDIQPIGDEK